jgi:hypothetical protein
MISTHLGLGYFMLRLGKRADVGALRDALIERFIRAGATRVRRRLTDPSGGMGERTLLWLPQQSLWAYFSAKPMHGRWFCWFGSDIGEAHTPITPSIEINLSLTNSRAAAGRTLIDGNGGHLLGHKGMLGGGRGGQMSMSEFGALIRGFVRESVVASTGKQENVFVIGNPTDVGFLRALQRFVAECERLRAIARRRKSASSSKRVNGIRRKPGGRELDVDGLGHSGPTSERVIRRIHGRVVNQLEDLLEARGYNTDKPPQSSMMPDLCVMSTNGGIDTLFEVKAGAAAHDWFEALGQLVVYGACEPKTPKRVLVSPAPRRDPHFQAALEALDVSLVTFIETKGKVAFEGLDDLFPRHRRAKR